MGSAIGQLGAATIDQTTQLISNGLNAWNTWRTNEQAYDQSRKLWNLNNEYNKPINQMKRLEEAGLNPFLVYGNGATGNTSSQPSSPSVQGTKFNINMANSLLLVKNLEKLQEEIDLTKEKNNLLKTQLGNLRWNSTLFKSLGLPTNSAWWSPSVFTLIKDPQKINWLKKMGFSVGEFLGGIVEGSRPKPNYINPNEINLDWNDNGVVSREILVDN